MGMTKDLPLTCVEEQSNGKGLKIDRKVKVTYDDIAFDERNDY